MSLAISKIKKSFGPKVAVDGISFKIDKPGVFGLLGRNGAGKTTTIRMILGILEKDEGSIQWRGKTISRESVKFGYLPEERGLYPKAKVEEQLVYLAKLRGMTGKEARKSSQYWLGRLGVEEYTNSTTEHLSKGNQQKIQLISALIHTPELIILDEPFSGLDPVNTELFKDVIGELIKNDRYIIMSTHQMSTIEEHCQELIILKDGKDVLNGNLKAIKRSYGRTNLTINCMEDITGTILESGLKIQTRTAEGYEIKISNDAQAYSLLKKMMDMNIVFDKFEIREPSLHEIFIEKAGDQ